MSLINSPHLIRNFLNFEKFTSCNLKKSLMLACLVSGTSFYQKNIAIVNPKFYFNRTQLRSTFFLGFQRTKFKEKNGLNKLAEEEILNHLFGQQFALHISHKTVSYRQSCFDFYIKMLSQLFFILVGRTQEILELLEKFQIHKIW